MRPTSSVALLTSAVLLAGCGTKKQEAADVSALAAAEVPALPAAQATPAAPAAPAALTQVSGQEAGRLAFVNQERLQSVAATIAPGALNRAVLGRSARTLAALPAGSVRTAVQAADATLLRGPGLQRQALAGARQVGTDGLLLGDDADTLSTPRPAANPLNDLATAAVQSCLGDPVAQTTLGPAELGPYRAIGAGLQVVEGEQRVAICFTPKLMRDIRASMRLIEARYPEAAVSNEEAGEVHVMTAVVPADALRSGELRDLLAGGRALQRLAVGG